MEALWQAVFDRLADLDVWRGNAPPEYKGSPSGSPYIVASVALSDTGDGYTRLATLTLDGNAYGDESAHKALVEAMEDAHEQIVTWRMQDTSEAGTTADWQLETSQPIETELLDAHRIRAVYTTTYVSVRLNAAYSPTIS